MRGKRCTAHEWCRLPMAQPGRQLLARTIVAGALGLSVLVYFGSMSDILFTSVGAQFGDAPGSSCQPVLSALERPSSQRIWPCSKSTTFSSVLPPVGQKRIGSSPAALLRV